MRAHFSCIRHLKIYYVNISGVPTACVICDTWIRTVKSHLTEFRDESELHAATSPAICKSTSQPVTELEQWLQHTIPYMAQQLQP